MACFFAQLNAVTRCASEDSRTSFDSGCWGADCENAVTADARIEIWRNRARFFMQRISFSARRAGRGVAPTALLITPEQSGRQSKPTRVKYERRSKVSTRERQ